jgi:hypothetical protein
MKATISAENKIDELLACLDIDIRHIQQTLSRLNELRSLVIKRDDVSLEKLLGQIQAGSDDYRSNESQRLLIREELAKNLGCDIQQITLSKLEMIVSENRKSRLADKKSELRTLTRELNKELSSTAMLLSDCARFNRLLLRSILGSAGTGTTFYGSNGLINQQDDMALVNLEF